MRVQQPCCDQMFNARGALRLFSPPSEPLASDSISGVASKLYQHTPAGLVDSTWFLMKFLGLCSGKGVHAWRINQQLFQTLHLRERVCTPHVVSAYLLLLFSQHESTTTGHFQEYMFFHAGNERFFEIYSSRVSACGADPSFHLLRDSIFRRRRNRGTYFAKYMPWPVSQSHLTQKVYLPPCPP
jgi:hypothetical protein